MVKVKEGVNSFLLEKDTGPLKIDEMKDVLSQLKGSKDFLSVQEFCRAHDAMRLEVEKNTRNLCVEVSPDGLEAYIRYIEKPTAEEIVAELNREGIVVGIDFNRLSSELLKGSKRILAAQGFSPGHSQDEAIEWLVNIQSSSSVVATEKIDFYNLDIFTYVKEGQRIARLIPPEQGTLGKTVYGKKILPSPPKRLNLRLKKGFKKVDGYVIVEEDGVIEFNNGVLTLDPVLRINSDVDYKTGNIDSTVNVEISGWVRTGFHINCERNVYVKGGIEEKTHIVTEGDLSVVLGIMGNKKTRIEVNGNLKAKFIQDCDVIVKGNMYINEYIMNSDVICEGSIFVNGKKGAIINSNADAKVSVELRAYKTSQKGRGIKVKGFHRSMYIETLKGLQKKRIKLKGAIQQVALKLRNVKKDNRAELESTLFEYQRYENELYKTLEEIEKINAILENVEGEGMVKILSSTENIKLRIKGQEINLQDSQPVKLYFDPEKRGVVQECIEKN